MKVLMSFMASEVNIDAHVQLAARDCSKPEL